ncbi:hypothetical protein PANDA_000977 [Ailuropoda melanoleuca]|uniref:Uncharacterized protein n=1 Tax=Ailuropoda melanoleuca TaxID=9646 RepID=D2GW25_AILME|nr:hypothetical protein PANDA_000977 [Ailuropoda melanoleuca]
MATPGNLGSSVLASKTKTKKKHFVAQKVKLFRASDPLLSVLMWGVNHSLLAPSPATLPEPTATQLSSSPLRANSASNAPVFKSRDSLRVIERRRDKKRVGGHRIQPAVATGAGLPAVWAWLPMALERREQQLDSKSANKQPEAAVQAGQRAGHLARFILVLPLDSGGQTYASSRYYRNVKNTRK